MKNIIGILLGILSIIAIALSWYAITNTPKVGFVQSQELIYSYQGTKEVESKFNLQKQAYQRNIDTLELDYQKAVSAYQADMHKLSDKEKQLREYGLKSQQESSLKYVESIQNKINDEEQKLLSGVLNQINSLVEEYGRSHGYDVILGTTSSGNLLFGKDEHDITEEILSELNSKFLGE